MVSLKLNMGQKLLRFWKVPSANLKIGKYFLTLAPSNFQELFVNKFDASLVIFYERIYILLKKKSFL